MKLKITLVALLCAVTFLNGCSSPSPQQELKSHIQADIEFVRETVPKVSYEMSEDDAKKIGAEVQAHQTSLPYDWKAPPEMVPALKRIRGAEQMLSAVLSYYAIARKTEAQNASGRANLKSKGDQLLSEVGGYANAAEQMLQSKSEGVNDFSE